MKVADGDEGGTGAQARQQPLGDANFAVGAGGPPVAMQAVGRSDRQQPGFRDIFGHRLMSGERLGGDRTAIGDRELRTRLGLAQPIGAGNDRLGESGGGATVRMKSCTLMMPTAGSPRRSTMNRSLFSVARSMIWPNWVRAIWASMRRSMGVFRTCI
jgi:hypothetical protein